MTIIIERLTLSEYFNYNNGADTRYELVKGELVPMSLGTGAHSEITDFLHIQFRTEIKKLGRNWISKPSMIGIQSPRKERWDTVRIPDVLVMEKSQWEHKRNCEAVILLNEPPPILVVEVVSESTKNTDYFAKQIEYASLNIPEYWIVDPLAAKMTICRLLDREYEGLELQGEDYPISVIFPNFPWAVRQILQGDV